MISRKRIRINWTLIVVLLTTDLLLRFINIFGALIGNKCIGHYQYWYHTYDSGFSVFGAIMAIFFLCLIWAIFDLFDISIKLNLFGWRSLAIAAYMVAITSTMLVGLYKAQLLSPLIADKIEAQSTNPKYQRLRELGEYKCRNHFSVTQP